MRGKLDAIKGRLDRPAMRARKILNAEIDRLEARDKAEKAEVVLRKRSKALSTKIAKKCARGISCVPEMREQAEIRTKLRRLSSFSAGEEPADRTGLVAGDHPGPGGLSGPSSSSTDNQSGSSAGAGVYYASLNRPEDLEALNDPTWQEKARTLYELDGGAYRPWDVQNSDDEDEVRA